MNPLGPKNIFLVDGLGAVVSALSLGLILPAFQQWIGMPKDVLYLLAGLAVFFACYSLTCFAKVDHQNPRWLAGIIFFNSSYCLLSLFFVVQHFGSLTTLGLTYFLLEKVIVLALVAVEWRIRQSLL